MLGELGLVGIHPADPQVVLGLHSIVGAGAHPPHADDQHIHVARGTLWIVFGRQLGLETSQVLAEATVERVGPAVDGRGQYEGNGYRNGQGRHPVFGQPAQLQAEGGDNQAEFAVLTEGQRGQESGAGPHPVAGQQQEEDRALDRQQQAQQQGYSQHLQGR